MAEFTGPLVLVGGTESGATTEGGRLFVPSVEVWPAFVIARFTRLLPKGIELRSDDEFSPARWAMHDSLGNVYRLVRGESGSSRMEAMRVGSVTFQCALPDECDWIEIACSDTDPVFRFQISRP
jgi:hypothetical protein